MTIKYFYDRLKILNHEHVKESGKLVVIYVNNVNSGDRAASKVAIENNNSFVITEHASAYGTDLIFDEDKPNILNTILFSNENRANI